MSTYPQPNHRHILPAVAAIIFNLGGEVLLQQRRDVNQWGLISGHVEWGETVAEAVLREVWEETGVCGRIKRLIGVYSAPDSQCYIYSDRSVHYVTTYFEVQLPHAPASGFANAETLALGYFPPTALPAPLARLHPDWLRDALDFSAEAVIR